MREVGGIESEYVGQIVDTHDRYKPGSGSTSLYTSALKSFLLLGLYHASFFPFPLWKEEAGERR
jgi:hypothetical protein